MRSKKLLSFFILLLIAGSFGFGTWYQSHKTRFPGNQAEAAAGTLDVVTTSNIQDTVGARFLDKADTAYFLDPASTGNSLLVAGSVGIGTTSPGQISGAGTVKLDVSGTGAMGMVVGPTNDTAGYVRIRGGTSGTLWETDKLGSGASDRLGVYYYNASSFGSEVLTILTNGNIGMGSTAPASTLDVAGTINATTFGTAVAKVTAQCNYPCTATATCAAGKNVIYGMSATAIKTCDSNPSTCTVYCTPGSSSCAAVSTVTGASVVIYCGKTN